MKKIILTGDRPTGPLHLGHYLGSLKNRVGLQNEYDQYILIADLQALTDNAENPEKIRENIFEVALDYLAVGINPEISTICVQSMIPEIAELTIIYLNLVTVSRLSRNPTVKEEMKQKGFENQIPAGFLMYPVHQAADITAFKANLVPVGADQLPMIEQAKEIVRSFNRIYNKEILAEPEAMVPEDFSRLPGTDGGSKMGKSLGNAIFLSDSPDTIKTKVMGMFTDPDHLRASDPGKVEGNPVFTYLDAFDSDKEKVEELKEHYSRGGLGDVKVKNYLNDVLQEYLRPIREKREEFSQDMEQVKKILKAGTEKAKSVASKTMAEVKEAMKIIYF